MLTIASLVCTIRASLVGLQMKFCKLSFASILLQNECCKYVRTGSALHTYVRKSTNCARLVLLFSLTIFVLHIWRRIVVWQRGFYNTLYYAACCYRVCLSYVKFVLQMQVPPYVCKCICFVVKMVCELSFAGMIYSFHFEIEIAQLRIGNYTCRMILQL